MLSLLRSFMNSRIGVFLALGFLILIALAFAAADVTGSNSFGGVAGGDRVATVGSRRISTSELSQSASSAVEQLRQENPRMSLKAFVAGGGLNQALDQLIDRASISVFGEKHGIGASERLIDSEITKIPAFRGTDGKFSETVYRQLLRQRGLSEAAVRQDIADGLIARQALVPAAFGARMPNGVVEKYAALLTETRTGAIALLPAAAFVPKGEPNAQELAAFYQAHQAAYIRPERRTIRYATFDDSTLKNIPAPTDAEIAARYNANKAQFSASESRKITQLVLPTEAAAKAVLAELSGGKTLEAAAAEKGLSAGSVGPITRDDLASRATPEIAAAAFSASKGKLVGPVRGTLGFTILRVDTIEAKAGKTLDQARPEIATAIAAEKKRAALTDFSAKIEDEFDKGGSLSDVAKELGVALKQAGPLTADGKVYGKPTESAPAELTRVVATAFSMEREGQPQLAEIVPGKAFIVYDVAQITPSAPAPIAEIRGDVMADLMLQKGSIAAKDAAEKLLKATKKGTELGAALGTLGVNLPPVQRIDINRQQFAKQNQQVPPPLALLFSMAQGTTKVLAAPGNRGWFVVSLAKIVPGDKAVIAPLVPQASGELSQMTGREYAEQLRRAMQAEVGVKRNQTAIEAVARQLAGN